MKALGTFFWMLNGHAGRHCFTGSLDFDCVDSGTFSPENGVLQGHWEIPVHYRNTNRRTHARAQAHVHEHARTHAHAHMHTLHSPVSPHHPSEELHVLNPPPGPTFSLVTDPCRQSCGNSPSWLGACVCHLTCLHPKQSLFLEV